MHVPTYIRALSGRYNGIASACGEMGREIESRQAIEVQFLEEKLSVHIHM
jgi:hypothetical protein